LISQVRIKWLLCNWLCIWSPNCEVTVTAAYRTATGIARDYCQLSRLGTGTCSLRGFTDIKDVYSVSVTLLKSCNKTNDSCACCSCETSTGHWLWRRLCNPGWLRVEFIVFANSYIDFILVMVLLWLLQILFLEISGYIILKFKVSLLES